MVDRVLSPIPREGVDSGSAVATGIRGTGEKVDLRGWVVEPDGGKSTSDYITYVYYSVETRLVLHNKLT